MGKCQPQPIARATEVADKVGVNMWRPGLLVTPTSHVSSGTSRVPAAIRCVAEILQGVSFPALT